MPKINIENVLEEFNYKFSKEQKDSFKTIAKLYVDNVKKAIADNETEEHCKPFLKDVLSYFYPSPEYTINTAGRADQAIKKDNEILVLIETKNPKKNNDEMPTDTNLNKKGFWELFLYYIENTREITNGKLSRVLNANLRTLIVTNYTSFIIFDAQTIDRLVTKKVEKFYTDFKNDHLQSSNNQIFYDFCKLYFNEIDITNKIRFVAFDFADLAKNATGLDSLAKIIKSYLIKDKAYSTYKPNVLNYKFYEELLYIMGLKEVKQGAKSLIELDKTIESSLGQQVYQIMTEQKDATEEEASKMAISLSILWVNRLLFIKLFEGQLVNFNDASIDYKILDNQKIKSFDDIFKLFFNVLGKRPEDRGDDSLYSKFEKVPYLNSSLFEKQEIEKNFINILELKNNDINLCPKTRIHGVSKEPIVKYIIDFLNSYNFSASLLDDDTLTESRDIIDSSVLGLIFEKINGYKDGSFYTRSEITEYIAKVVIERCVIDRINKEYNTEFKTLDDVKDFIDCKEKRIAINQLINGLKICDPAVGSGHFLVSALNRILALKYELGVLLYSDGNRFTDYVVQDIDDILEVKNAQGERFVYNKENALSCLVQESLFNEKRYIIENCLFGIDLNPDAVAICRLRLWIELLKNAYYKNGVMETLPNIDINIKVGNSLISTVDVKAGTSLPSNGFTSKKMAENVASYKELVKQYKRESDKAQKREIKKELNKLKSNMNPGDERVDIFGNVYYSMNPLYRDAFEWMFEFPELLNEAGVFDGFDAIIGNPPYGVKLTDEEKKHFKKKYQNVHVRTPDTYRYFISRSLDAIKDGGYLSFIVPNNLLFQLEDKEARSLMVKENKLLKVINLGDNAFNNANVPTCIFVLKHTKEEDFEFPFYDSRYLSIEETNFEDTSFVIRKTDILKNSNDLTIGINSIDASIIEKVNRKSTTINLICSEMASGVSTGGDDIFKITKEKADELSIENELLKFSLSGREVNAFENVIPSDVLIYLKRNSKIENYPNTLAWLTNFKEKLQERSEAKSGVLPWFALNRSRTEDLFIGKKIIIRQTADKIIATIDTTDSFVLDSLLVLRLINENDYEFVLGVLNSSIGQFIYKSISQEEGRAFAQVKPQNVRKLYVPTDDGIKDKISSLVKEIMADVNLKKEKIKEINKTLYDYYELTDEEIQLVGKETDY